MDIRQMIWRALREEIATVETSVDELRLATQRSETTGGVVASTLAEAPLAADGGLSDGSAYIDLRWITNGRKPAEGVGAGSGVLAFYDAVADLWKTIHDYQPVTT